MHRFVWLILAFLVLAIGAPYAMADGSGVQDFTYTYALVDQFYDVTFTTDPIPAATTQTFVPVADLTSYSLTGEGFGENPVLYGVTLNLYDAGDIGIDFTSSLFLQIGDEFAQADFSNPGTYTENFGTVKVAEAPTATPEPGSFALIVAGLLGLMFAKRNPADR